MRPIFQNHFNFMSRIKLLQPQEIILFNQAPLLDLEEKSHFFSLTSPFDGEFKLGKIVFS